MTRPAELPPRPRREQGPRGVRSVLLWGVFWRILTIEGILLVGTLAYEAWAKDAGAAHLFWYGVRILGLVAVIIAFMMVTLRSFLTGRIILPLERIADANRSFLHDQEGGREVRLSLDAPKEIQGVVDTRAQMLATILRVSEERLRLATFIRDTFGKYVSKSVVDAILASPAGAELGGQRKTVTVLMSDLRGFTGLSERRGPEEMVDLLNRYLERMSEVILGYRGLIDEFIGDAILAVFGAPTEAADDPARAVACGLAMQNALGELNRQIAAEGYGPLEMGVGINTGPVVVGNIGSPARMKYGIVGPAVNTAARIEANTTGGQVLIGESTYGMVRDLVRVEAPLTVMTKGLKRPLVNYPVVGIGGPYGVDLVHRPVEREGVELHLAFRCWELQGKRVAGEARRGETVTVGDDFLTVALQPLLEPLTDVKLVFDFCVDAHCFDDIYAKVVAVEEGDGGRVNRLRITSMHPRDRDLLNDWIARS